MDETDFRRVRYCVDAPSREAEEETAEPVFLGPPSVRPAWRRAMTRAAASPRLLREARRAGIEARTVLRFLLWTDTGRRLGVAELVEADQTSALLARHLPPPLRETTAPEPTIAGLVIANNEEAIIARALSSLASAVDELVVVDDESSDSTAQVARDFGARVLTRALRADFAAQRNHGLAHVRSEWVVALDADEVLDPGLGALLRRVASWSEFDSVFVPRSNSIADNPGLPVEWPDIQVRAFRSRLRYAGSLHERITGWRRPAMLPLSGPAVHHDKDLLRWHRTTLRYHEMDPHSPYPAAMIAEAEREVARLERGTIGGAPPGDGAMGARSGRRSTR